jgi:hypothetical protein
MARKAKAHEIFIVIGSALGQRLNVVHVFHGRKPVVPLETNLTVGMRCHIPLPDSRPFAFIFLPCLRISAVAFISLILFPLMFLAEPPVR